MDPDRPPGWYAASRRSERFWDGAAWTGRRRVPARGATALAGSPSPTGQPPGRWVLVGAVVAMVVVMGVSVSTLLGSDDDGGGRDAARDVCEGYVGDDLGAPSTVELLDTHVSDLGDRRFSVRASVRPEDAGVSSRTDYTCEVRYTSGKGWDLLDLHADEPS